MSDYNSNDLENSLRMQVDDEHEAWRYYDWLANKAIAIGRNEIGQRLRTIASEEKKHAEWLTAMIAQFTKRPISKQLFVPSDERTGMPESTEEWERLGNKIIESDASMTIKINNAISDIRNSPDSENAQVRKRYLVGYAAKYGIISY